MSKTKIAAGIIALILALMPVVVVQHLRAKAAYERANPPPRCEIVGDHEIVTGNCIPYCPPKPSECG